MKRKLCPTVLRFLVNLYTSQTIQTKWGGIVSESVSVSNGVKQGGVMSPILFIVYMDELFKRLAASEVGCFIGNKYCGSFGYADDVILLCPTLMSIRKLLNICESFAIEFDVLFNPTKSKLLVYNYSGRNTNDSVTLNFMNGSIIQSQVEKHLGNVFGPNCNRKMINSAVNDLYVRVNMVLSHFSHVAPHVRYKLFKMYCMSLYGCQLWDFQNKNVEQFHIAWRKSVRRILGVPPSTHCKLLHCIAEDKDLLYQLYTRFIRFIQSTYKCNNSISNMCLQLAFCGSRSHVSNNISIVCSFFNIARDVYSLNQFTCNNYTPTILSDDSQIVNNAHIIRELLYMKHISHLSMTKSPLTRTEIDHIINYICTE